MQLDIVKVKIRNCAVGERVWVHDPTNKYNLVPAVVSDNGFVYDNYEYRVTCGTHVYKPIIICNNGKEQRENP